MHVRGGSRLELPTGGAPERGQPVAPGPLAPSPIAPPPGRALVKLDPTAPRALARREPEPPSGLAGALSSLGAAVGSWAQRLGISALGAVLSMISTLPDDDASRRTIPVRGAPLGPPPDDAARPSLAATFDALKTIGGGPARAQLLTDNTASWNARWAMLESAKSTIDASYFIVEKDPFGYAFLGHLLKKQREGVKVRLLIDAMADTFGKHGFKMPLRGKDFLQELVGAGSDVGVYHPVSYRVGKLHDYGALCSNHDKIIAVDGRTGMTGGRNIGLEYFAHPTDTPAAWRDTDILIHGAGPAAALTKSLTDELAQKKVVLDVKKDRFGNLRPRDVELIGAYAMMDLWLRDPVMTEAQKAALRADPKKVEALAGELVTRAIARLPSDGVSRAPNDRERAFLLEQSRRLVTQLEARGSRAAYDAQPAGHDVDVKILDQTSVVAGRRNDFAAGLVALTQSARRSIVIENPYVVLTEEMIQALEAASQRGVEIIIGTNSPLSTDSAVTQALFLEDWAYILARVPTARILVATGERKLHAKVATIDDEVSIVSSYNLDLLSGYVNGEVGAVVKSSAFNREMGQTFLRDLDDPKNGILEYTILRDESGKALLRDGKPIPVFGPEDHLPPKILADYKGRRETWNLIRAHLPYFAPVRHPTLEG